MIEHVYGAQRVAEVMEDTWGHLRPDAGRHVGHLVAARSAYDHGRRMLIEANFGDEVPDSPWMYDLMRELIDDADLDEGGVYRFDGACLVNGPYISFEGNWTRVETNAR